LKRFLFASALLYFPCIPAAVIARAEDPSALVKQAVEKSTLDQQGTRPFHLKATCAPTNVRDNDSHRTGEIEVWWQSLIEGSRSLIHAAFVTSVKRAIASGDLRMDTDPNDFVRALVGVFHTTALPGWEQSARRLVNILIKGSYSAVRCSRSDG
jgi:hypothetical protein